MNITRIHSTVERKFYFILSFFLLFMAISSKPTENTEYKERVKKRSFQAYPSYIQPNSISIFRAANVWKPSNTNFGRPYYIPVYGGRGRLPIFYPPQPFHSNVGTPVDNPSPPYQAPGYLPPSKETPKNNGSSMDLGSRFQYDYDDAPIWGSGNIAASVPFSETSSSGGGGGGGGVSSGSIGGWGTGTGRDKEWGNIPPTRAPSRERKTFPPLVHRPEPTKETLPSQPQQSPPLYETEISAGIRPQQSAQALPQPQFQRPNQQFPAMTTIRIPTITQPVTTSTTTTTTTTPTSQRGPSNCVWAIISCCSVASPTDVPHNCFEQRGCPGPFWGSSPCQSEYARAAIEIAVNYYKRNNSK